MRRRIGYVSNSSSCSFLLNFEPEDSKIKVIKLTDSQRNYILEHYSKDSKYFNAEKLHEFVEKNNNVWLTQFISDCRNDYIDFLNKMKENKDYIHYSDGEMSEEPYDPEYFNKIDNDDYDDVHIWIRCEDDKDNLKMTTVELCKFLKKEHKNSKFNVFMFGDRLEISKIDIDEY